MPTGIRPIKKLEKVLYKIMNTPKSLQQNNEPIPKIVLMGWRKENLPTTQSVY